MNKNFVTIIVVVKEDYDISKTRKFINEISEVNKSFVELFVIYTSEIVNNNNNNYIIIDISANNINNTQAQSYIELRSFLILKLIYTTLVISILFIGFLYLTNINIVI
jgi:hypothetical protein